MKIFIFLIVNIWIFWISRSIWRQPREHGFYRFFAFETILLLFLLNGNVWFRNPLSWNQLSSWCCLMISLFLVIHSFYLLKLVGRPKGDFEKTTRLVQVGVYRYIRHPMYSSLLWLAWGIFFKQPSWFGGILALLVTAFLTATAFVEEQENLTHFGAEYVAYRKTTRWFIPYLF